jgi:hypothetical protein
MSFDQDLKQAFERHAGDVSPTPGAWTGVERRIRRSHRVRAALAAATGTAAVIAAIFVVPGVLRNSTSIRPVPPATRPPANPPVVAADKGVFRNERDGYWLQVPNGWNFGEFEGHVSWAAVGSVEQSGPTFAVELWVDSGAYNDPARLGSRPTGDMTIAGRPAKFENGLLQSDKNSAGSITRSRTHYVDWTGYNCPANAPCPAPGPSVLIVKIEAADEADALWEHFGAEAEEMVRSIRLNSAGAMPKNAAVATRRGSVDAAVDYDQTTSSVVKFMEARIEGGGAEPWLTKNTADQYANHDGDLSLYSPSERASFSGFVITERKAVDANSFEYTVVISVRTPPDGQGIEGNWNVTETLSVGPGSAAAKQGSDALIRAAQRSPRDPCFYRCQPGSSPL